MDDGSDRLAWASLPVSTAVGERDTKAEADMTVVNAEAVIKLVMDDTTNNNEANLHALTKAVKARMPTLTKYSVGDNEIQYRWKPKITRKMVQATSSIFLRTLRTWLVASPGNHSRTSVPCNQVALYTVNGNRTHRAARLARAGAETVPPAGRAAAVPGVKRKRELDSAVPLVLRHWKEQKHDITKVHVTGKRKRRGVAAVEIAKQFRSLLGEESAVGLFNRTQACPGLQRRKYMEGIFYYLPPHHNKRRRHGNVASSSSA